MEKYPLLMRLQQELQDNFSDIKAESLLGIAIEYGLTEEDFVIASESCLAVPMVEMFCFRL
jgi:hypothetical protein